MTIYAIGDLQGCLSPLKKLLSHIAFNPNHDQLLFCGDLVNRGPESLETLRFIKSLVDKGVAGTVLGNHDIHLLAVAAGASAPKRGDTLDAILNSRECRTLTDWLARQPLSITLMPAIAGAQEEVFLSHAGLYPFWDIAQAETLGREASDALRGKNRLDLLNNLYGNEPTRWVDSLTGLDRLRFIINAFTRMRYVTASGHLAMRKKGSPKQYPTNPTGKESLPWYELLPKDLLNDSKKTPKKLIFGHWSSLAGHCPHPRIDALDTGYVWSGALTALNLSNSKRHLVHHPKSAHASISSP